MSKNLVDICVEAYTPVMSFLRTDTPLYKCSVKENRGSYCLKPENYNTCQYHKDYEINKIINTK